MQWVLFGAAGNKDRPAAGQLAGFNRCTGVLSKQMKCLGSAFWLHETRTFRPTHVHQCTFRDRSVALLGDGQPLPMRRYGIHPGGSSPFGWSYDGHLEPADFKRAGNVTDALQIVLFHYVTRSQNAFIERKIKLRSGVYATMFAETAHGGRPSQDELDAQYAAFEHKHGFDGQAPVCEQGGAMAAAMAAARAAGWSELS